MRVEDLAAGVRRLRQDDTLMEVLKIIKQDAIQIFENPNSDPERILEAHQSVQAVGTLIRAFDAIEADDRIKQKEQ